MTYSVLRNKIFLILIVLNISVFLYCKPKAKVGEEQILGVRYSKFKQNIFKEMGSSKKEDIVSLLYDFEEVNVIEKLTKDEKDYYKLTTVDKKNGFGLASNFAESVYFVTRSGLDAFNKPSLTSGTKGKIMAGSVCLQKEIQAEWSNVDCQSANYNSPKLEDWYNVWIQNTDEKISKDPLLGETALLIREGYKLFIKSNAAKDEVQKLKLFEESKKSFSKAKDKVDIFASAIDDIMLKFEMLDIPNPQDNKGDTPN
jgi:lipoprotein LenA